MHNVALSKMSLEANEKLIDRYPAKIEKSKINLIISPNFSTINHFKSLKNIKKSTSVKTLKIISMHRNACRKFFKYTCEPFYIEFKHCQKSEPVDSFQNLGGISNLIDNILEIKLKSPKKKQIRQSFSNFDHFDKLEKKLFKIEVKIIISLSLFFTKFFFNLHIFSQFCVFVIIIYQ